MRHHHIFSIVLAIAACILAGCGARSQYRTPGAGADVTKLFETADEDIQKIVARQPESPLPANLVVLRLQDTHYYSYSCRGGSVQRGVYNVITTRDIEKDEDFQRIGNLSQIAQVGTVNRLLLPHNIVSDKDLRLSAAKLHADMLFLYTVDTKYWSEDNAKPLSVVTLGFSPSVNLHMVSTLSGVLCDVRTGYIYGTVEATEKQKQLTSWWANSDTADQARLRVERIAFEKMLDEFEKLWIGVAAERAAVLNIQAAVK
ncbi:MAG: hypothetical protein ABFR90_10865 [Planctomycetota bacterium]